MRFIAFLISLLALCAGQSNSATARTVADSVAGVEIAADATKAEIALIPRAFIIKDETGEKNRR